MGRICAIRGCSGRNMSKIPLFELSKKTVHYQKWIEFLNFFNIEYSSEKKYYLCILHFCNSMIIQNEKKIRLNINAFPTINSDITLENPLLCLDINETNSSLDQTEESLEDQRPHIISNIPYKEPLVESLCRQLIELKTELETTRKIAFEYQMKYENAKQELDMTKEIIEKYISSDQWNFMSGKKVKRWDDKSIQKGIVLKQMGGENLINFCRKYLIPVPSCRSLCEVMQNLVYSPGIIHFNINLLKYITENFSGPELFADIKIDEKSVIPGQSYESSTKTFVGCITLPHSSRLATNAFAVLLTMMKIRIKILVGYHFMDNTHDVEAIKLFLYDLICYIEHETSVKINSITMDMCPSNISLVNSMGLSLRKYSRDFSISHPMDSQRKLFILFDAVHNLKNLANGLRNHNITVSKDHVLRHNLQ